MATVGVDNYFQCVQSREGSIIQLRLLDTAGQEIFKSIVERYYRQADCCMLVYDILREIVLKKSKNILSQK